MSSKIKQIDWKEVIISGAVYFLMTAFFFRAIFTDFDQAIIGDGHDGYQFLWNFWWVKKSLLDLHQNPLVTDFMFHPHLMDLRLHTLLLAPIITLLPIELIFGPVVSLNVYALASFTLAGLATYLLARVYISNRLAAFFAGTIFAFNCYVFSHAYGHFNLTTTWPIPLLFFFLERQYQENRLIYSIGSALAFLFLVYSDLQYTTFTIFFLALWIVWKISQSLRSRKDFRGYLKGVAVFFLIILIGLAPFSSFLKDSREGSFSKPPLEAAQFYSPDLLAFVIPPEGTPANKIVVSIAPELAKLSRSEPEWAVYLGVPVIILIVIASVQLLKFRQRPFQFWFLAAVAFLILSLGPKLHVAGRQQTGIMLPYRWLHHIPVFNMTRVPARFLSVATLGLAITAALIFSNVKKRTSRTILLGFFIGVYIWEISMLPVYIAPVTIPPAYDYIKLHSTPEDRIMEFPLYFTDRQDLLGRKDTKYLAYQTYHERKMVSGYLSYTPPGFLDSYAAMSGMLFLINPEHYPWPEDKKLQELRAFIKGKANVSFALIHKQQMSKAEQDILVSFFAEEFQSRIEYDDAQITIMRLVSADPSGL